MSPQVTHALDVVILGAGVLGLSIAQELTDKGVKVGIVARDLPEDSDSSAFASPWAGANWASFAGDNLAERARDTKTFHRFAELSKKYPDLISKTPYYYVSDGEGNFHAPWYKDLMFDYRDVPKDEVPKGYGITNAITFTSYTLNPPKYIAHLAASLRAKGVPIVRHRLASLDEAYSILGKVDLVVNACGLGARTLLGVEDNKVFPARGQTVLVEAKNVRTCYGYRRITPKVGESTYIIPRPGPDGYSILGGTFLPNDYSTLPDPAVAERILKGAFEICPQLAGEDWKGKTWKDIKIISHNVGLRPCREGGLRLELEERKIGQGVKEGLAPSRGALRKGDKVGVVHAYGIGPAGFQSSLGVAEEATDIVLGYLRKQSKAKL